MDSSRPAFLRQTSNCERDQTSGVSAGLRRPSRTNAAAPAPTTANGRSLDAPPCPLLPPLPVFGSEVTGAVVAVGAGTFVAGTTVAGTSVAVASGTCVAGSSVAGISVGVSVAVSVGGAGARVIVKKEEASSCPPLG